MQFKVGQKVTWASDNSRLYLLGAEAIVKSMDSQYLFVEWLPPVKQANGGYYLWDFKSISNEQLLFSFMLED